MRYQIPFISFVAAPNEIIALGVAIDYYLRFFEHSSPSYKETSQLLLQFQARLIKQLPSSPLGTRLEEHARREGR
ncbi:hypothetical protein EPA93_24920 [Ktedonosporobacter rubrisoli]|uniref:Uncharacterized protein n=1 Tax=Ktedonosporobacter rubrisoli TaxID=2509675 RepID=A0A4V0YZA6_KTERU|nr:hypothetical protein [Ktedonosporobacter rubrisoli]QBD79051.1 hypothetical protein EPA93_24920 [Ktedonosporobacter rubrisoli]